MTCRLFGSLAITLTVSVALVAGALSEDPQLWQQQQQQQQQLPLLQRSLQDSSLCAELKVEAVKDVIVAASPDSCACGSEDLKCQIKNACISSDGAASAVPLLGDYSVTVAKTGTGESYTQLLQTDTCFTYPSSSGSDNNNNTKYAGAKACITTTADGLGGLPQCFVSVNGEMCTACKYCASSALYMTFNCSNIGFEFQEECVAGNANGTVLQFLHEPESVTTCEIPSGSPVGMAAAASGGAMMITLFSIIVAGVLSMLI